MNIKSLKKAAGVVEAYLESIGKSVKHTQALEVVARAYGHKNWNVLQGSPTGRLTNLNPEIQELPTHESGCRKCGSPVVHGYCSDDTCPCSDWPQYVSLTSLNGKTAAEISAEYGIVKRIRVSATLNDDAVLTTLEFDAGPWFAQASDEDIRELREIGWRGDYAADEVALFFEDTNSDIANLVGFCQGTQGSDNPIGFECAVDGDEAMNWLKFNKTQLWAKFLCQDNNVDLVEATEEEIRGRWDWLCGNDACDMSFETEGEAAINAVLVLGLDSGVHAISEEPRVAPSVNTRNTPFDAMALYNRIRDAGAWQFSDSPLITRITVADFAGRDPSNEVFYFAWETDGLEWSVILTEDDLINARVEGNKVIYPGEDGEEVLELFDIVPNSEVSAGMQWLLNEAPLTENTLEALSANDAAITAIVSVPFDTFFEELDVLNDYVSERITGSIVGLTDISYQVYHISDTEREQYGTPDTSTVLLQVTGQWNPD